MTNTQPICYSFQKAREIYDSYIESVFTVFDTEWKATKNTKTRVDLRELSFQLPLPEPFDRWAMDVIDIIASYPVMKKQVRHIVHCIRTLTKSSIVITYNPGSCYSPHYIVFLCPRSIAQKLIDASNTCLFVHKYYIRVDGSIPPFKCLNHFAEEFERLCMISITCGRTDETKRIQDQLQRFHDAHDQLYGRGKFSHFVPLLNPLEADDCVVTTIILPTFGCSQSIFTLTNHVLSGG